MTSGPGGGGQTTIAMANANQTLTTAQAAAELIKATGVLTATRTLFFPAPGNDTKGYQRTVRASVTGAALKVDVVGGAAPITIAAGKTAIVAFDAAGASRVTADANVLPVEPQGGFQMAQPKSHRVFFRQQQGRIPKNVNLEGFDITRRSVVAITAGQFVSGGPVFDQDVRLTVHGPDVYVTNICPHGPEGGPGGVEFMLHVDSDTPIDVAVTISVFEPWDSFHLA